MFATRLGPDGQPMFRITGGASDIPDDDSLYHSQQEWDAIIADSKYSVARPERQLDRIGVRAFAKLNGGQSPAPTLNGGLTSHAPQVHAGDVTHGQLGDAPAKLPGHDDVWARYNGAGGDS